MEKGLSPHETKSRERDLGFSHIAIFVEDLDRSIDFYSRFGGFTVKNRRTESSGASVAWLNDAHSEFFLVMVQPTRWPWRRRLHKLVCRWLPPLNHFGVSLPSRAEVDSRCAVAVGEGCLRQQPRDMGPPVGYYGLIRDPDGNDLEVSHGQEMVGFL